MKDIADKLPKEEARGDARRLLVGLRSRALIFKDNTDGEVLIPVEPIELSLLIEYLICVILCDDLDHMSL